MTGNSYCDFLPQNAPQIWASLRMRALILTQLYKRPSGVSTSIIAAELFIIYTTTACCSCAAEYKVVDGMRKPAVKHIFCEIPQRCVKVTLP